MDTLIPFCETFEKEGLEKAVAAAEEGAKSTAGMKAKFGRGELEVSSELRDKLANSGYSDLRGRQGRCGLSTARSGSDGSVYLSEGVSQWNEGRVVNR